MFHISLKNRILPLLAGLLLCACVGTESDNGDKVLATVDGSPVTQSELDLAIEKFQVMNADSAFNDQVRHKALESLVAMRAMAQAQEQSLDPKSLRQIDLKAQRYREELLAEAYLRENAKPYVPTGSEIEDYYRQHPQLFGARTIYSYEVLMPENRPRQDELAGLLKTLSAARSVDDWRSYAARHDILIILQNQSDGRGVDDKVSEVIKQLDENETSSVINIDGKPQVVRLLSIEAVSAKPLLEVQTDIRKTLAIKHMKAAIGEASKKVLQDVDVVYMKDAPDEQTPGTR